MSDDTSIKRGSRNLFADLGYADPETHLLKAEGTFDQAQALAAIEAKLLEGLTGPETAMTAADWKALRQEALASVQGRSKKP